VPDSPIQPKAREATPYRVSFHDTSHKIIFYDFKTTRVRVPCNLRVAKEVLRRRVLAEVQRT